MYKKQVSLKHQDTEEMSSDAAFTDSDYEDTEQQRLEFGDQVSLASPKP